MVYNNPGPSFMLGITCRRVVMFKDEITVIDNVLTAEECDELIRFYESCSILPGAGYNYVFKTVVSRHDRQPYNEYIKSILTKVLSPINENYLVQRAQIECRSPNTEHVAHNDERAGPFGSFTTVLYLNDTYTGGNTYIETEELVNIEPKRGRMVGFNGHNLKHGVSMIRKDYRYTLSIWYVLKPADYPKSAVWWLKC